MNSARRSRFGHAVVCGGGFAGLLTAHVLSEVFDRVTLVERDPLSGEGGVRPGVPQAYHGHGMAARGAQILEELFPGLREELREVGAPVFDAGTAVPVLMPAGWTPRTVTGVQLQFFSRAALEDRIRARVLAQSRITVLDRHEAHGLSTEGGRAASGVSVRPVRAGPGTAGESRTIAADLVVDAQGRSSRLPRWLSEAGSPQPPSSVVDARYAYASRLYAQPASPPPEWVCTLQMTYAPSVRRGGAVAAVEGGRWIVSLMGAAGDLPPTTPHEFEAFAAALENPYVAQAMRLGQPLSPVRRFTRLTNRWHRYDRLGGRHMGRLVVIGDALCTFNPVYGHGMTVAAVQALILRDVLRARLRNGGLDGVSRIFQRRAARAVRLPWLIATSSDLGWQDRTPGPFTRLVRWYVGYVLAAIVHDTEVYLQFLRVQHMLTGPTALLRPRVLLAILGQFAASLLRKPSTEPARPSA
ncbi:monooxygenase [Streptomyces sp. NPDC046161]|uniref:FAD-dependent oxidoreductase n=1 Tax=Streptomyces sp. NPDC046161 TaxID=3155132 RepID=UPI0033DC6D03